MEELLIRHAIQSIFIITRHDVAELIANCFIKFSSARVCGRSIDIDAAGVFRARKFFGASNECRRDSLSLEVWVGGKSLDLAELIPSIILDIKISSGFPVYHGK